MENFYLAVIPAKAVIPLHKVLRDSRFRGSDINCTFFGTLRMGEAILLTRDT
jgi:hypothetical protein